MGFWLNQLRGCQTFGKAFAQKSGLGGFSEWKSHGFSWSTLTFNFLVLGWVAQGPLSSCMSWPVCFVAL